MLDCKIENPVSIFDRVTNDFALRSQLLKNHTRFFARTFYGSSGKEPPRTIYKELYLEPLKLPAEHRAEEHSKVLHGTFF